MIATRAARIRFAGIIATTLAIAMPMKGKALSQAPTPAIQPIPITSPAATESSEPWLAVAPDGTTWLSWVERVGSAEDVFRASRLQDSVWSKPVTIAQGDSFFVNWADVPSVLPLGGGRLVAHWPWKTGIPIYAYDVRVSQSADDGRTWGPWVVPHSDGTPTEHGFASMAPHPLGTLVVWLDGRDFEYRKETAPPETTASGEAVNSAEPIGDVSLRGAVITREGRVVRDKLLPYEKTLAGDSSADLFDAKVCDCCPTALVTTRTGFLVAYRDRAAGEVRDISLMRYDRDKVTRLANSTEVRGAWSKPYTVHPDRWRIEGCPVNGPAMDANGDRVAIAWYTEGSDTARVLLAFSKNGGVSFAKPVRVDDGRPHGRVDVVLLQDGSALVTWLEDGPEKLAYVRARHVAANGVAEESVTIAKTSSARASGFPRMVRSGKRLVFAWTDITRPSRVRTAIADLP
jgi:hypothetical protein